MKHEGGEGEGEERRLSGLQERSQSATCNKQIHTGFTASRKTHKDTHQLSGPFCHKIYLRSINSDNVHYLCLVAALEMGS